MDVTVREVAEAIGVTDRAIRKKAKNQNWPSKKINARGDKRFAVADLPLDVQKAIVGKGGVPVTEALLPALVEGARSSELEARSEFAVGFADMMSSKSTTAWTPERAVPQNIIHDDRVMGQARMVQEAENVPAGQSRTKWVKEVAAKHGYTVQHLYRCIKRYNKCGLAGLMHKKNTKGKARTWDPEAIAFWVGTCLKKENRKIDKKDIYDGLVIEAHQKEWRIGSYASALWWFNKSATPQFLALQRGGVRALDNTLPPVLRDYSDLEPFELLVGDQHRFDFWVVDDDTGEVFRPEGYFWQDLCTRNWYGGAVAKRYDSMLMGLALRIGIRRLGLFKGIYTDHGKPEESRYIMSILKHIRALGIVVGETIDAPLGGEDAELVNPLAIMPGTHVKAIVRNAKAKMIEGRFGTFENVLRSKFRLPGSVKRLADLQEYREVDHNEAMALAEAGKLPTFREFVVIMYKAMDYMDQDKPHRGVLREWGWTPKPKQATPMQCLEMHYKNGWRPTRLSEEATDLIFLPEAPQPRTVDRGRILFRNEKYECDAIVDMSGKKVTIQYDPLDIEWVFVFHEGRFIGQANLVEYSSMKDQKLASRKIEEKRRIRKAFLLEYRKLTTVALDMRQYSEVPQAERVAAKVKAERGLRNAEKEAERELYRERTQEELDAEVRALEVQSLKFKVQRPKPLPERPVYFMSDLTRYEWCTNYEMAGGQLQQDDVIFKAGYEARMSSDQREYWETVRRVGTWE